MRPYLEPLVINRAAIILRYREPAVRWINEADPDDDDPGLTQEGVNQERTVYLIRSDDSETSAAVEEWMDRHYRQLFEAELEGWYTDPTLWRHIPNAVFRRLKPATTERVEGNDQVAPIHPHHTGELIEPDSFLSRDLSNHREKVAGKPSADHVLIQIAKCIARVYWINPKLEQGPRHCVGQYRPQRRH